MAARIEAFVASGGPYVCGAYPDIDGLFRAQAGELDAGYSFSAPYEDVTLKD